MLPEFSTLASEIYLKNKTMLNCLDILMTDLMKSTISNDEAFMQFLTEIFGDVAAALMNTLIIPLYDTSLSEPGVDLSNVKEDLAANGLKCLLGLLNFGKLELTRSTNSRFSRIWGCISNFGSVTVL